MKAKDYFIYIFTAINVFIFVALLLLKFGNVTITGPLGDTFGGLLSPVIGIISIILIYETFKAQRAQLVDQENANKVEKSSTYFTELKQLLEDTERQVQSYYFTVLSPGISFNQYYGIEALYHFFALYEPNVDGVISSTGNELLNSLVRQLSDLVFIAKKIEPSNSTLTSEHYEFIEKRFINILRYQLSNSERAFRIVKFYLRDISSNSKANNTDDVNTTIKLLVNYNKVMNDLQQLGYVEKDYIKQVNAIEFYENQSINTDTLQSFNFNEYFKLPQKYIK